MPNLPAGLQEKIEEQVIVSRQLQNQLDENRIVSTDSDGAAIVSRAISVPELDLEAGVTEKTATTQATTSTESPAPQDPAPQAPAPQIPKKKQKQQQELTAKPKARTEDTDLLGQLEKRKRKRWAVQVGAFESSENADRLEQKLKKNSGNYPVFIQKMRMKGKDWRVVFLGPIASISEAEKRQKMISKEFKVSAVIKAYGDLGRVK